MNLQESKARFLCARFPGRYSHRIQIVYLLLLLPAQQNHWCKKNTHSVKFYTSKVSICVHTIEGKFYTFDSVNFLTSFECKFNTHYC